MIIKTGDAEFTAVPNVTRGDAAAIRAAEAAILDALRSDGILAINWIRRAPVRNDPEVASDGSETVMLPRAVLTQLEDDLRAVQDRLVRLEASQGVPRGPKHRPRAAKSS